MDNELQLIFLDMLLRDVVVRHGGESVHRESERLLPTIEMPETFRSMQRRRVAEYLSADSPLQVDDRLRNELKRQSLIARNDIISEIHARASFGVSCLILVMVGSVLGMRFRSGDFLSAFAVSVIPALITITLVVGGTQTSRQVTEALGDPLILGLSIVWLGNAMSLVLAGILFWRLSRT
jgi:lipopolysaccharide export LptBFGC system permease protein LptF